MTQKFFDFTPDPKVLIALTQNPMNPFDAICELIDNSIDSFESAVIQGINIENPSVYVDIPNKRELSAGIGVLRVTDNGPGMTAETAERAIKAGFSGNNPYDSLGLFGMGFNISTGKIGRCTKLITARNDSETAIEVVIDLEEITKSKDYFLPVQEKPKDRTTQRGTIIEVNRWWPEGTANYGFIRKLVDYGVPKIREEIGRRYATLLKTKKVSIYINRSLCEAYEHCVWSSNRYVERKGEKIYARYDINELLNVRRRCASCRAIVEDDQSECPSCSSTAFRSIEERVTGWIGIQRFDHSTDFGIDLIRNGRAIKIAEKRAFFEYVDEFQKVVKDYPIDQQYGRIVGEIHLDFVPVDFLKQDFQRSSEEWQKAMSYLRGNSSLQPTQPNADKNTSVLYKLYQGYRKVRIFGIGDMYMGYWDPVSQSPKRIARETEEQYFARFLNKEKGYYDDEKWWDLVEEASAPPAPKLIECPSCSAQNLSESETCFSCGYVLIGKKCINEQCDGYLPRSAVMCSICGLDQIIKEHLPWKCSVCGSENMAEANNCISCNSIRGTIDPLSQESLRKSSVKKDDLSVKNCSVILCDGKPSLPIDVDVHYTITTIAVPNTDERSPLLVFKSQNLIEIFIDSSHNLLTSFRVPVHYMVACEVAKYIFEINHHLVANRMHNFSNLTWKVSSKYFNSELEVNAEEIREDIEKLFEMIKEKLTMSLGEASELVFDAIPNDKKKEMLTKLVDSGIGTERFAEYKETGKYAKYIPDHYLVEMVSTFPEVFFNGKVWNESLNESQSSEIDLEIAEYSHKKLIAQYRNSMETIVSFALRGTEDELMKALAAYDHLTRKMTQ
jgi:hypothetical protein